ncbi:roadblock/LC7 domain-containing protein [Deinococcus wulumuqiensis]|uniref:Roadblock/LAMTOR2 domain-containing protein n=1 Tax=Deinococcus wulumuqiensis TaxID=980427 RepID=A0AAV4K250_9DEIO|nr:roadblock/LC7 domain-containing protein [Deinococcus wulumuqiensis]QII20553.1 roadblock/LC7 domain-containing protein [Deinococcus wulumuqiensis R12]GGI72185.1 hypothetical protein GCM10010914_02780 [Deinococcus wulumuqiensis]GGP30935.1 hypothetical protein GCM10008021_25860 [Deinococcus wulumuqiensis]
MSLVPDQPPLPDLSPLLDVRGVQGAGVVDGDGQILNMVGSGATDPTIVAAARAVLQSLQAATDSPSWHDLLLDLDSGPLLLMPCGAGMLLVRFDEVPSLGRVRLGVRRVLAQAQAAGE